MTKKTPQIYDICRFYSKQELKFYCLLILVLSFVKVQSDVIPGCYPWVFIFPPCTCHEALCPSVQCPQPISNEQRQLLKRPAWKLTAQFYFLVGNATRC